MKEKFKNLKELMADKKYGSLIKLGLWFIFLLFVVIYVRVLNSKQPKYAPTEKLPETITEGVKPLKDVNSYEFSFEYTFNNDVFLVTGKRYNTKWLINYNDNEYYFDDSDMLKENEPATNIENFYYILMLDAKKIYEYLLTAEIIYKQEFADNVVKINSKFNLEDSEIIIETSELNNQLENISANLTNYCILKDENCLSLKVLIKYSNLNLVEDFN